MKKIDCHMHLIGDEENKRDRYLKLMPGYDLGCAVAIPDNKPLGGKNIDLLLEAIKNYKEFYAVGTVDILDDDIILMEKKLDKLFRDEKIKGIKFFPGHDPFYITNKRCFPFYELCIKYDYPLIIHTGINPRKWEVAKYNDPKYIVEIAKKFPKLKILVSHYFFHEIEYCYKITKNSKNIYFDTSGLADKWVTRVSGGVKKIRRILEKTISNGSGKVLFGTDWPCEGCEVDKHIKLVESLKISEELKKNIFYKNTKKIFRI